MSQRLYVFMKLMLRPEWRLWPLASFLGLLDLKTGVTIALLFALLNKVAGVYGLIAVLTGAGGSFAQLTLYIYSAIALIALAWGLRAVKQEDPKQTLYFAHLFFADHILSTAWTVFFALVWWLWTPHDGRRQANSDAQKAMMQNANITDPPLSPQEREAAAMAIWNHEKGTAAAVIAVSWIFKFYFALLIYSYAMHLRKGSYRTLPFSRATYTSIPPGSAAAAPFNPNAYDTALDTADDDDIESFYHVPLRSATVQGHSRTGSATLRGTHRRGASASGGGHGHAAGNGGVYQNGRMHKHNNSSISSFADFVSAPGSGRHHAAAPTPAVPSSRRSKLAASAVASQNLSSNNTDIEEEVLFDEDELTYVSTNSSRPQSKVGTEGSSSTAASTDEERERAKFGSD